MCNWPTRLRDGGLRSRYHRTGDRSDHGGMNHLFGDQIIRPPYSKSQEFADELSLTVFAWLDVISPRARLWDQGEASNGRNRRPPAPAAGRFRGGSRVGPRLGRE